MKKESLLILQEVFEVVMEINNTTDMACFLNVSGHVSEFKVRICKTKEDYHNEIYSFSFYYDGALGDTGTKAKKVLNDLTKFLDENKKVG